MCLKVVKTSVYIAFDRFIDIFYIRGNDPDAGACEMLARTGSDHVHNEGLAILKNIENRHVPLLSLGPETVPSPFIRLRMGFLSGEGVMTRLLSDLFIDNPATLNGSHNNKVASAEVFGNVCFVIGCECNFHFSIPRYASTEEMVLFLPKDCFFFYFFSRWPMPMFDEIGGSFRIRPGVATFLEETTSGRLDGGANPRMIENGSKFYGNLAEEEIPIIPIINVVTIKFIMDISDRPDYAFEDFLVEVYSVSILRVSKTFSFV